MLKEGKISPRKSSAGATILFIPNPYGRLRLVVDYRGLNKVTIHNKYPIPLMTELRDQEMNGKPPFEPGMDIINTE